ncbi:hypothetical protein N9933_00970 [bacterium]|nr:hypothetical protein [bacterium]
MVKHSPPQKHQTLASSVSTSRTNIFNMLGLPEFSYVTKISFEPLIRYWEGRLKSLNMAEKVVATEIQSRLAGAEQLTNGPIEDVSVLDTNKDLIQLLNSVFIPFQQKEDLVRFSGPFSTFPFYHSPALIRFLDEKWTMPHLNQNPEDIYKLTVYRAGCLLLNRFYGQKLELGAPYVFSIIYEGSMLEKHYKVTIDSRFIDVKKLKPLKKLTQQKIHELLNNVSEVDLWLEALPPDSFELQGVISIVLRDITTGETLSSLKDMLLEKGALISKEKIELLEGKLRSFFKKPNLRMGIQTFERRKIGKLSRKYGIKHGFVAHKHSNLLSPKHKGSIYEKTAAQGDILINNDLSNYPNPTHIEKELMAEGIQSIIIIPLFNKQKKIMGFWELGFPEPHGVDTFSVLEIKKLIPLLSIAVERGQKELDNQIDAVIRGEFTAIHPSVEWVFVKKALNILNNKDSQSPVVNEESLVFRGNYPLYGQADIVGSTAIRNKAIQADIIENLYQIKRMLKVIQENFTFPLADEMMMNVEIYTNTIKRDFSSNNEVRILEFIRNEVNPLFRDLRKKHKAIQAAYFKYTECLDRELKIVYRKRKAYEESVAMLNGALSRYLDEQQVVAQKMLPHYFEKFQTDGVAYNIYIGKSLLKKGKFTSIHLRNLRLWQLINMCEMTRMVKGIESKLPVPLSTAQLILVHSTPLAIRFRMDEKRFDVDGAYNVRYEIVKKRIDKALIEGTRNRLTVAGKIAIVYQREQDKAEYLRYLRYLIKKGYIEKKIEELMLSKLQGVHGLKALRVTVIAV